MSFVRWVSPSRPLARRVSALPLLILAVGAALPPRARATQPPPVSANLSENEIERADGWIALRIRGLLMVRSNVSARHTDVFVRDGVVTLRGVAADIVQKELTEAIARGVTGVKAVQNEISVAGAAE